MLSLSPKFAEDLHPFLPQLRVNQVAEDNGAILFILSGTDYLEGQRDLVSRLITPII